MKRILTLLFLLLVSVKSEANAVIDELPATRLVFSVFKDTIVTGFDTEFEVRCSYDLKKLSISATGCSVMLKDAEKGIYVVKASVASVGKTSIITISLRNDNGSVRELEKFSIPIVGMTTEMKKRYVKTQIHKK